LVHESLNLQTVIASLNAILYLTFIIKLMTLQILLFFDGCNESQLKFIDVLKKRLKIEEEEFVVVVFSGSISRKVIKAF
jgi:hypothetical protein